MRKPEPEPPGPSSPATSIWTTAGCAAETAPETALEYASVKDSSAGGAGASSSNEAVMRAMSGEAAHLQTGRGDEPGPCRPSAGAAVDEEGLVVREEGPAGHVPQRRDPRRLVEHPRQLVRRVGA